MATALNVTPAGNGLFQVDIVADTGDTRVERSIEVGVSDVITDLVADRDVALQDVAREAVRYLLDRGAVEDLPARVELADVADRHEGFVDAVVTSAEDSANVSAPPPGQHTAERSDADADDRLVAETRAAQEEGQASSGQQRR